MRYLGILSLLIAVLIISWWAIKSLKTSVPAKESATQEGAIAAARALYFQKKSAMTDFSQGPCLSEEVITGWAVDIAHNPRTPTDNMSFNQCQSFVSGQVKHFVELDPDGNLIQAK